MKKILKKILIKHYIRKAFAFLCISPILFSPSLFYFYIVSNISIFSNTNTPDNSIALFINYFLTQSLSAVAIMIQPVLLYSFIMKITTPNSYSFLGAVMGEILTITNFIFNPLKKLNENIIILHRENAIEQTHAQMIADHILYKPQLELLTKGISAEESIDIPYMSEVDTITALYKHLDYKDIVFEHMKTENLQLNNIGKPGYEDRLKFILNYPYTLKEVDYTHLFYHISHCPEVAAIILKSKNVIADWQRIEEYTLKNTLTDHSLYKTIKEYINDKKAAQNIHLDRNTTINNNSLMSKSFLHYEPYYQSHYWNILKENYKYLQKYTQHAELEAAIAESLTSLMFHDNKIRELKSQSAINKTKEMIDSILKDFIELSEKHIENMELNQLKDIRVEQKYQSMRI